MEFWRISKKKRLIGKRAGAGNRLAGATFIPGASSAVHRGYEEGREGKGDRILKSVRARGRYFLRVVSPWVERKIKQINVDSIRLDKMDKSFPSSLASDESVKCAATCSRFLEKFPNTVATV